MTSRRGRPCPSVIGVSDHATYASPPSCSPPAVLVLARGRGEHDRAHRVRVVARPANTSQNGRPRTASSSGMPLALTSASLNRTIAALDVDHAEEGGRRVDGAGDEVALALQLVEAGAQLGEKPVPLEREPRRSDDRLQQLGLVEQRAVVDEHRDRSAVRRPRRASTRARRPPPGRGTGGRRFRRRSRAPAPTRRAESSGSRNASRSASCVSSSVAVSRTRTSSSATPARARRLPSTPPRMKNGSVPKTSNASVAITLADVRRRGVDREADPEQQHGQAADDEDVPQRTPCGRRRAAPASGRARARRRRRTRRRRCPRRRRGCRPASGGA